MTDNGQTSKSQEGEADNLSARFRRSPWQEIPEDPIPGREILTRYGELLSAHRDSVLRATLAFFLSATLATTVPLASKFIIDNLFRGHNFLLIHFTAGVVLIIFLLRAILSAIGHSLLVYVSTQLVFDLRKRLFERLQLMHLAFYEREQSSRVVSRVVGDAQAVQMLIQNGLPALMTSAFTLLMALILMSALNIRMTGVALIVTPLFLVTNLFFRSLIYHRAREASARSSEVAGNVSEVISGIRVVKSFGMEDREQRRFVKMMQSQIEQEFDLGAYNAFRITTQEFLTGVSLALVISFGGVAVVGGAFSLGDYVAFMLFITLMFSPLAQVSQLVIQTIQARAGMERILHVMELQPAVTDRDLARKVERLEGHVVLEDVTFGYQPERMILNGLNLEVQPGEVVALVGPTGAGKSTVVNLLMRFYDPTEGRILVDGVDLRNLQLKSYRGRLGIVLQDAFLFSGTIFDNICYGKGRATVDEVEEAARQANAIDFIRELPEGMDTQVGERGALLSGGQRQLISIARALLKDPDILILDEATSSVDVHTEGLAQQALERLMSGRTVFVIAHRPSTIQRADRIVVLNEGRIVEMGRHEELMTRDGYYSQIYGGREALTTGD